MFIFPVLPGEVNPLNNTQTLTAQRTGVYVDCVLSAFKYILNETSKPPVHKTHFFQYNSLIVQPFEIIFDTVILVTNILSFFLSLNTESIKFRASSQVWWVAKF